MIWLQALQPPCFFPQLCRDIKPENLLLFHPDGAPDGPEGLILKVVDYGCSTFCVPGKRLCKKFGTVSTAVTADVLLIA
jgi:serine/threonine protein kinase